MTFRNTDNWPVEKYVVQSAEIYGEGVSVDTTDHSGFGITKEDYDSVGVLPSPGEEIILLGGLGRPIQGIFIGGREYKYRTKVQAEQDHQKMVDGFRKDREKRFYENIDDWIQRKNSLYKPFRDRLHRFQSNGFENFWMEDGGYELFCVEQANRLYVAAKNGVTDSEALKWLDKFAEADYDQQKKMFPRLDDGHSGNTFGAMIGLAKAVARGDSI